MKEKPNNAVGPQVRGRRSKRNKLVPVLALTSMAAGLQAATQYFAYTFNYQATLGLSFNHAYAPWSILSWYSKWGDQFQSYFFAAGSVGSMVAAGGLIGTALTKIVVANSSKANEYLHGSARWANKEDILEAGLLGNDQGVYVGAWEDKNGTLHYLRHNGPEHVLTYAPTRSGKGVGLVVPTLLSWPHSTVVTDLKGELWAMTAGWRQKHAKNKVIRFEPATLNGSAAWNPLDEIRIGTEYEVGDVQNLATLIVDPDGKGLETHWQKTSQALLVGVILHILYKAKRRPAGDPAARRCRPGRSQPRRRRVVDGNDAVRPRQRREPPRCRGGRPRHDGPARRRSRFRSLHREVLPRALPRSGRGAERQQV